jgi:hypothetical protein
LIDNCTNQSDAKPSVAAVHYEKGVGVGVNPTEQETSEAPLLTEGTYSGETVQRL